MDASDPPNPCSFWDYVDTCRLSPGTQSHTAFVLRTRHYYGQALPARPEIETWPDLVHYVSEVLNEEDLRAAAYRTWTNYLVNTAPFRTALSNRQLWRLRRQLREAQEAQLKAEEARSRAEEELACYLDRLESVRHYSRQLSFVVALPIENERIKREKQRLLVAPLTAPVNKLAGQRDLAGDR